MSNSIAVVTESGFGKSTSYGHIPEYEIEGLPAEETLVINIKGKPLPFRGWRKLYTAIDVTAPPTRGNYLETTDPALIIKTLNYFSANRPDIKNALIDDFQYVMAEEFMSNALKTGFDKYNKLAKNAYDVINAGLNMRPDMNFIILTHSETDKKDGTMKMKTIGKMLDEKVTLQGLFTVVLYGKESFDATTKAVKKEFVTNYDGEYPAKSPVGMFPQLYINNDLGAVVKTINQYYDGE
jgi:hypothetical protein